MSVRSQQFCRFAVWTAFIGAAAIAFGGGGLLAHAADVRGGERLSIGQGEGLTGNLYAAGGTVTLGAQTPGDATVVAGDLMATGAVGEDVTALGGELDVLGPVGGDARLFGGDVVVGGTIDDDLLAVGGSVHVLHEARIENDAVIVAGDVVLEGEFGGDVWVRGQNVRIDGVVDGSVDVGAGESVTLGANARIDGDLRYQSPGVLAVEDESAQEQVAGEIQEGTYRGIPGADDARRATEVFFGTLAAVLFFATLFTSLLFVALFREPASAIARESVDGSVRSLLLGLALWLVVPLVVFILLASLIGSLLALLLLALLALVFVLALLSTGILAGMLLARLFVKESRVSIGFTALGVPALHLIGSIPLLGPIIVVLFFLTTSGAIVYLLGRMLLSVSGWQNNGRAQRATESHE